MQTSHMPAPDWQSGSSPDHVINEADGLQSEQHRCVVSSLLHLPRTERGQVHPGDHSLAVWALDTCQK